MAEGRQLSEGSYGGKDIQILEGLDAVRKRPGMYIGGTGSPGLQHCVWEIFDNSVDEAIAGFASHIEITLHPDGSIAVHDNGRGIPVDREPKTGLPAVEVVLTKLHAGGKFGGGGYKSAGGLHGVGASVVNALSARLDATVSRDGKTHTISFQRGKPGVFASETPDARFTPRSGISSVPAARKKVTGTQIRFWPDRTIFTLDAEIDPMLVTQRARQTAFLVPGLTVTIINNVETPRSEESFHFVGGIADMVNYLNSGTPVADPTHFSTTATFEETVPVLDVEGQLETQTVTREVHIDVAFAWNSGYDTTLQSFVNVVATPKGGTHVKGFERGLVAAVRKGYEGTRILKSADDPVAMDDIAEGMTAVISVGFPEPQFEGQTKEILGTPALAKLVQDATAQGVAAWLTGRKKNQARAVLEKVANAARARAAARTQREAARRKTAIEGASMPAKLVDCRATGVTASELFIVEGDSALGCFTEETLIATTQGPGISFKKLADDWSQGLVHFGYAKDQSGGTVVVPLIEPRLTLRDAPLVEVSLDNGTGIQCTPDHLFLLNTGTYRPATQLTPGDTLMSLARPSTEPRKQDTLTCLAVTSVQKLQYTRDVYDLTVDDHHNFALDAGVFVHNSARLARNSEYQALLPIRGKILNVQKANLTQMLNNSECSAIIQVMGTGSGRSFNLDAARYGRVILMTDADVDGSHIRVLLLTLFHKYLPGLIEAGRLYAAVPPLFKVVTSGKNAQVGYAYTPSQLADMTSDLVSRGFNVKTPVTRFKGLGEMDADELWETTMDPTVRTLRRITMEDTTQAADMLELLMGDDVAPRREWIIEQAKTIAPISGN